VSSIFYEQGLAAVGDGGAQQSLLPAGTAAAAVDLDAAGILEDLGVVADLTAAELGQSTDDVCDAARLPGRLQDPEDVATCGVVEGVLELGFQRRHQIGG